jgi:hypothetical protein
MFLGLVDPHTGPSIKGADLWMRIRTKMSRVRNAGFYGGYSVS